MKEQTKVRAGILVAAGLAADGLIHVYWTTGNIWPAPDEKTLSLAVLNMNVSFGPFIVFPLACLLFCGALTALARVHCLGRFGQMIPNSILQRGILVIATGLLLRSLAGIIWVLGLGADPSTTFYWLNLLVYTPLCLILFAATVAAARSGRSHGHKMHTEGARPD
ncbi:DUF3995 domain-containing protein [Paenibacillus terrigena]|uniref:DUF3995 domain-containing protein n=1 Tax=Paenibacillus terrigena TaxID=369333 RepID=UPI0028D03395|nr:DUF3995 domain-containing protein [Paenibacillus terrigena]